MGYAATIGFFDGVHIGHRYVLQSLCRLAKSHGLESMVVTFREHPRALIEPRSLVHLLTSPEERMELLTLCGVDKVEMLDFASIKTNTAEEFMRYLHKERGVEVLLMGYDHRFGSDGLWKYADYETAAQRIGLRLQRLPEYTENAAHVSSTVCRRLLRERRVEEANRLLGYCYTLSGIVGHGKGIGRTIGFPTANLILDFPQKIIPADGVYAAEVMIEEDRARASLADMTDSIADVTDAAAADTKSAKTYQALVNIGSNPTVGGGERVIEVNLLDFAGDLYGKRLSVHLLRYLRDERTFPSLNELRRQIEADKQALLSISKNGSTDAHKG